jgi:hypothetical protein
VRDVNSSRRLALNKKNQQALLCPHVRLVDRLRVAVSHFLPALMARQ